MSGEDSTAQPIRVVLITGAPGSGKTTAAERLARLYRVPAAVVDADWLAGIWPWREDEGLYRLIADNLAAVMAGHRRHGARVLVVSGVFLPGRVLAAMRDLLADPAYTWVAYGLRANASTIGDRIAGYRGVQDPALRASMSALDAEVGGVPGVREIRTDGLAAEDVLAAICAAERADGLEVGDIGAPQPAAEPVPLGLRDAAALGEKALIGRGVPAETAAECVRRLIAAWSG